METLEKLLKLTEDAEKSIGEASFAFLQPHFDWLENTRAGVFEIFDSLKKNSGPDDSNISKVFAEVDKINEKIFSAVNEIQFEEDAGGMFSIDLWDDAVSGFIGDIDEMLTLEIDDDFWNSAEGDSLKTLIWKKASIGRIKSGRFFYRILNVVRKVLRKSAISFPNAERSFSIHNFLRCYFDNPVRSLAVSTQKKLLSRIVEDVHLLHEAFETLRRGISIFEIFENGPVQFSSEKLENLIAFCSEFLNAIDVLKAGDENFLRESKEETAKILSEIKMAAERDFKYAATFPLPEDTFSDSERRKEELKREERKRRIFFSHVSYVNLEKSQWAMDRDLFSMELKTALLCMETVTVTLSGNRDRLKPIFGELKNVLAESGEILARQHKEVETESQISIVRENRNILRVVRQEKLPALLDAVTKTNLYVFYEKYVRRLENLISSLPSEHTIVTKDDFVSEIPAPKYEKVGISSLLGIEFQSDVVEKNRGKAIDIKKRQEKLLRRLNDIDNIIETNFEASRSMLKEDGKDKFKTALEVALEGITRTVTLVDELAESMSGIFDETAENIYRLTREFEKSVEELANTEKIIELKLRFFKQETSHRTREAVLFLKKYGSSILALLLSGWRNLRMALRRQLFSLKKLTGLVEQLDYIGFGFTQYLSNSMKKIEKLPYVYQRLFREDPLSEKELFRGRERELTSIRQDYALWKEGFVVSLLIAGEKGSGKTTILNIAEREIFTDLRPVKIVLTGTVYSESALFEIMKKAFDQNDVDSMHGLENAINSNASVRICIVENLQNLFLRSVKGFDALDRFLLLISRTHEKVFWISTCGQYAYEYLENVCALSKYFQKTMILGPVNPEELEDLVMVRHYMSGYELNFIEPENIRDVKKYRMLETDTEKQSYLKSAYFDNLASVSAGNIRVAVLLWLNSVKEIENEVIGLQMGIVSEYAFISQLPDIDLFTLAAIVRHDNLSIDYHSLIFRIEGSESARILERLATSGILVKKDEAFLIHPFLFRSVIRTLQRKNLLH